MSNQAFDRLALAAFRAYHGPAAENHDYLSGWQLAVWRNVAEEVIKTHNKSMRRRIKQAVYTTAEIASLRQQAQASAEHALDVAKLGGATTHPRVLKIKERLADVTNLGTGQAVHGGENARNS
jgi:hypothetical protein